MAEETVKEMTDLLSDKETEEQEEKEFEKELETEESEKEIEKEEETEEGKEDETKTEKSEALPPNIVEVTKKYPNLFKDFPNLRHAFFHEKEYRELFPSVEEAREAAEDLEGLRDLEEALTSGKSEDTSGVLESIKELGDEVLPNLATNFLPSLRKIDQDLYYQVITPELVQFTRQMFDAGLRNENDNLKNAALVAAVHFFGDPKIASGEKEIKLPAREQKREDTELEKERQSFRNERYSTFYNDVIHSSDSQLSNAIMDGLDPKETMTEGIKELISEKVLKEITKTLSADNVHISRMNSLWKKAGNDNFSNSHKSKIVSAYLEAAKEIMPRIRAKVRANVLGIRERHPVNETGRNEKRVEPKSTTGGGQRSSSNSGKITDAKKVDWRKTSDLDFIKDNVTLKS